MKAVKKIKEACFLACIKSFLEDHNILITQEEMINQLVQKGLCTNQGVVYVGKEEAACLLFNIRFSDVPYHYPINSAHEDGSLLIGTWKEQEHCMRFYKQEKGKIIVMNPESGELECWDEWLIEKEHPNYHKIELLSETTDTKKSERK